MLTVHKQYPPDVAAARDLIMQQIDHIYARLRTEISPEGCSIRPSTERLVAMERQAIEETAPYYEELARLENFAVPVVIADREAEARAFTTDRFRGISSSHEAMRELVQEDAAGVAFLKQFFGPYEEAELLSARSSACLTPEQQIAAGCLLSEFHSED